MPDWIVGDRRIRIYGGGSLIFDEYGQLKYQIANHLANGTWDRERQSKRILHLAERGFLDAPDDSSARLSALHLARAGVDGGGYATR